MNDERINILLIENTEPQASEIRTLLKRNVMPTCHVMHCTCLLEAMDLVGRQQAAVDLILLDLGLVESNNPQDLLHQIENTVDDIPLIVFTGRSEHDLALVIVREGTQGDGVIKERFSASPERLKDAVEFALARNRILREIKMSNAAALEAAKEKGAAALKEVQEKNEEELRYQKQLLAWMMGGYSIDNLPDDVGTRHDGGGI